MVGDLTDQIEDNACKGTIEQKKIEKKTNPHHVDQISVNTLNTLMQSSVNSDEENQREDDKYEKE